MRAWAEARSEIEEIETAPPRPRPPPSPPHPPTFPMTWPISGTGSENLMVTSSSSAEACIPSSSAAASVSALSARSLLSCMRHAKTRSRTISRAALISCWPPSRTMDVSFEPISVSPI
jgi:hypothetical protein